MVIVEKSRLITTTSDGGLRTRDYTERRTNWGLTVAADYSTYNPKNYEPHFLAASFGDVYGSPQTPLIGLVVGVKRNFPFGSVGLEIGGGNYANSSDPASGVNSTLNLYPVRLGGTFALETLMSEPYVVPYFATGAYMAFYKEATSTVSFNGNTQPALYALAGLAIQLDWIDKRSARLAFEEMGLENTFLLLEARKFFASWAGKDPDFSNDVSLEAGLRLEF